MDYIDVVKLVILAERTSNWELHLFATTKMLNLFASTGHIHYAKGAHLYVQKMQNLPKSHPWLYQQFVNQEYTVKRTAKNFTGIWTDLATEETLMRSIKLRGGLTEGRGMTKNVRHLWVLGLSYSASIHEAMIQLSKAQVQSSKQHAELGTSRRKHDHEDCERFLAWLTTKNSFMLPDVHLFSLSNGVVSIVGKDDGNCEKVEEIGLTVQKALDDVSVTNASIKRKDLIKPLDPLQYVKKVKSGIGSIDSKVMFNRMIAVAEREESLEQFFEYELTSEPMSIFKGGMMRKPDKPSLCKVHFQVMCWSLLGDEFNFSVCEWRWKNTNNLLVPITTDMPIAPESLTKVIRCRCKTPTKNSCGTKTCTCRKYGMACVSSCGECHVIECNNTEVSKITFGNTYFINLAPTTFGESLFFQFEKF